MENGDTTETGLNESYLTQSFAVMEGKYGLITSCTVEQQHVQRIRVCLPEKK